MFKILAEWIKLLSEFGKDEPMTIKILSVITCIISGSVIVFFADRNIFYNLDFGKLIFLCITIGISLMCVNYFLVAAATALKCTPLDGFINKLDVFVNELDVFINELDDSKAELEKFKAELKKFNKAKLKKFNKAKLKEFNKAELKEFKTKLDDYSKDEKLSIGYILLNESMVLTWCQSIIIALWAFFLTDVCGSDKLSSEIEMTNLARGLVFVIILLLCIFNKWKKSLVTILVVILIFVINSILSLPN